MRRTNAGSPHTFTAKLGFFGRTNAPHTRPSRSQLSTSRQCTFPNAERASKRALSMCRRTEAVIRQTADDLISALCYLPKLVSA
jgi:hypothetical protein